MNKCAWHLRKGNIHRVLTLDASRVSWEPLTRCSKTLKSFFPCSTSAGVGLARVKNTIVTRVYAGWVEVSRIGPGWWDTGWSRGMKTMSGSRLRVLLRQDPFVIVKSGNELRRFNYLSSSLRQIFLCYNVEELLVTRERVAIRVCSCPWRSCHVNVITVVPTYIKAFLTCLMAAWRRL